MADAPGVRDAWAPERELIVADVVSAVRAELAALNGEILRVIQAECRTSHRTLAAAVDRLAAPGAKVGSSATMNRQRIRDDVSDVGRGSSFQPVQASSTRATSVGVPVSPPRPGACRESGSDVVQKASSESERLDQQHEALQPSNFSTQLISPRRSPKARIAGGLSKIGKASCALVDGSASMKDKQPALEATKGMNWNIAWHPESASRTAYEMLSLVLLLFDAVTLPYTLAWSVPEEGFWMVAVWCTRLFWSMDLVVSFLTGYQTRDLKMERHLSLTARNFLRTWFLCDAALVIWDWCGSGMPSLRLMRLGRFARLLRQSQRMYVLLQKAKAMLYSKASHLAIDISILLLLLMWLAHVLCCLWYVIGKNEEGSDTGATWLSNGEYSGVGSSYEYLTALHWSLTQITPASMEVVPKCSAERAFNVFVIFFGFVVGSSMVATLTAMMTQYRMQLGERMRKMRQLHDFLVQENTGKVLTRAIKVQINSVLRHRQKLRANQVELLPLVSSSLKNALNIQVRRMHLAPHPLLGAWAHIDSACLVNFVQDTMSDMRISIGDALFFEDDPGTSMFFVLAGSLLYRPGGYARESVLDHSDRLLRCNTGEFCCEIALWFDWCHLGLMTAVAPTEIAVVDVSNCDTNFLRENASAENVLRSYALAFQHAMQEPHSYPSDLIHDISYNDLMFALPVVSRIALSRPLFDQIGVDSSRIRTPMLSNTQVAQLEAEVAEGKTMVGIAGNEMVRVILVVVLRIYLLGPGVGPPPLEGGSEILDSARFLVRLGAVDLASNVVRAGAKLPGAKRSSHETPMATVTRIVDTELMNLIPGLDTRSKHGRSRDTFIKESPTFGVRTCYSRTSFIGFTNDDLEHFKIPDVGRNFKPELPTEPPRYMDWLPTRAARFTAEDVEMHKMATNILQQTEIFWGVFDEKVAHLYAWLNEAEFATLSDERAQFVLTQYGDHLSKRDLAMECRQI